MHVFEALQPYDREDKYGTGRHVAGVLCSCLHASMAANKRDACWYVPWMSRDSELYIMDEFAAQTGQTRLDSFQNAAIYTAN